MSDSREVKPRLPPRRRPRQKGVLISPNQRNEESTKAREKGKSKEARAGKYLHDHRGTNGHCPPAGQPIEKPMSGSEDDLAPTVVP
ncbi:hypothetical protein M5689_003377 [Euphorbia peplus]|nr:hypothetical protein M5689_003377 [Euphorbia peplus]